MRIAVVLADEVHGTGFGTRVLALLRGYAAAGHSLDVFHVLHGTVRPSDDLRTLARNYVELPSGLSPLGAHAHWRPPVARATAKASRSHEAGDPYDVVQSETTKSWTLARRLTGRVRVLVLHDDEARRQHLLASTATTALGRLARETASLKHRAWDRYVLRQADECWFVSDVERRRFARWTRRSAVVPNGAPDAFYVIGPPAADPLPVVLFVGPATYDANLSGVRWFVASVWPLIRRDVPNARLRVVGLGWQRVLRGVEGVEVPGFVDMLEPELARSRVVIAPIDAGGGTNIKVVEAMAAGRPVCATPFAAEGLPASAGVATAKDPGDFAQHLVVFLRDAGAAARAGAANRTAVEELRWERIAQTALRLLDELVRRSADHIRRD